MALGDMAAVGSRGAAVSAAVLSLGSNVGDRLGHLRRCVQGFAATVRAISPVYSTQPWGGVEQGEFLNAVLLVDDDTADAVEWLRRGRQQEAVAQRSREIHWGPRTLDVDVITVDDVHSADPDLTLPHPRAHERAFVGAGVWQGQVGIRAVHVIHRDHVNVQRPRPPVDLAAALGHGLLLPAPPQPLHRVGSVVVHEQHGVEELPLLDTAPWLRGIHRGDGPDGRGEALHAAAQVSEPVAHIRPEGQHRRAHRRASAAHCSHVPQSHVRQWWSREVTGGFPGRGGCGGP